MKERKDVASNSYAGGGDGRGKGGREGKGASGEEDIVFWVGRGAASQSGTGRVQRGGRSLWRSLEDAALPSMKVAERGPPGSLCGHRAAAPPRFRQTGIQCIEILRNRCGVCVGGGGVCKAHFSCLTLVLPGLQI